MSANNKDAMDELKFQLHRLEEEEERARKELQHIIDRKESILDELGKFSDTKYEEDMLAMVYEQRKKIKNQ